MWPWHAVQWQRNLGAARTQKHADDIFAFPSNDSSQGHAALTAFGIPGEAGPPYQAEQVRCKVGARGRSVSWWIPNVKAHLKPERWDRTLKLQSPEEGGGWGRERGKSTGGGKKNKLVAPLQSRVLWIVGDNVTADFCRGSPWFSVSFFMAWHIIFISFFLFFLLHSNKWYTFHAVWGVKITALSSSWNYSPWWSQFMCHHFLDNEIISSFRRLN